jgi:hypothetical protein
MLAGWCGIRGLCLACGEESILAMLILVNTEEWYRMWDVVVLLSWHTCLTWLCRRISGCHFALVCTVLSCAS